MTPAAGNPISSQRGEPGRLPNTERVVLRDGSTIHVRPIGAGDKAALRRAFEHLTPDSRYRRFLAVVNSLDAKTLAYLTEVDHHSHEALVAVEPDDGAILGVARYVTLKDDPDAAEVAMVVADDWQGRGLATVLLAELTSRARDAGVHRFRASCLSINRDAIEVLESLGPTSVDRCEAGVCELTIALSAEFAAAALETALGHAASGQLSFKPIGSLEAT